MRGIRLIPRLGRECPARSRRLREAQLVSWRRRHSSEHSYAAASRADALFSPVPSASLLDDSLALPRCALALSNLCLTSVTGPQADEGPLG